MHVCMCACLWVIVSVCVCVCSLFVRSFLSTAFLALFLSRGSQRMCVYVCITDFAAWFQWAGGQGLHTVTELDCKEQFNYVQPADVEDHMDKASAWLSAKRRWRMPEVI